MTTYGWSIANAHRPEVCYVSQGFDILGKQSASVGAAQRDIPVTVANVGYASLFFAYR